MAHASSLWSAWNPNPICELANFTTPHRMPPKMSNRMLDKMPDSLSSNTADRMPQRKYQIGCQMLCQRKCQSICQVECQIQSQTQCQIQCQNICQIHCHIKFRYCTNDQIEMSESISDKRLQIECQNICECQIVYPSFSKSFGLGDLKPSSQASSFGALSAAWCSISSYGLGRNAELIVQQEQDFDSFTPIIYIYIYIFEEN